MSDDKEPEKKKLSLSGKAPGTLQLKKSAGGGQVQQKFSHGRSKSVVVEHKRRRVVSRPGATSATAGAADAASSAAPASAAPATAKPAQPRPSASPKTPSAGAAETPAETPDAGSRPKVVLRTLTDQEKQSRALALENAREADIAARKQAEIDAEKHKVEEARAAAELDESKRRQAAESERLKEDEGARKKAEEEAARRLAEQEEAAKADASAAAVEEEKPRASRPAGGLSGRELAEREDAGQRRKKGTKTAGDRGDTRRRGKMSVSVALQDEDAAERQRSLASLRRARERRATQASGGERQKIMREVVVPEGITVQELANRMAERLNDVTRALMKMGVMTGPNEPLDQDTAELVIAEFGHTIRRVSAADVEDSIDIADDPEGSLKPRPPIVTVMGHVDHGKTSLLDALRTTDVASGEAGGITQHIGAYQVTISSGDAITFLDTPGHAAFTAMRARGAKVTDIVILVVAADDGIMPQTVEAIQHAKAAEVPIIIAINKMDKEGANPDRVRQELLQHEIVVEEMGGDVLSVEVSATKKINLDKLEEAILLQSEVLELNANPDRPASGIVVEATLEKGRGTVATLLVDRGTLNVGDAVVCGSEWGRVRALVDDHGRRASSIGPSGAVEVLGLNGTPSAGDPFSVVSSDSQAREISEYRQDRDRTDIAGPVSLEEMFSRIGETKASELPVLIKADVQGSVEAIVGALNKLSTDEVTAKIIASGVGGITESDVQLALASGAPVIGFNVRANKQARDLAAAEGVELRYYSIIYNLIDEIRLALSGMLAPTLKETVLGGAEVLEVFGVSKVGKVAGCMITEGIARRGARIRLLRDDIVIYEGGLNTLRRFKDEVREVQGGNECGMAFENFNDIKVGDMVEIFEVEEISRELEAG